jgi:hypothetical protein
MRSFRRLTLLLIALLVCMPAIAQFTSGIEGTVQDQSGAAIPGAEVTITDNRLGVQRNLKTNEAGHFRIDNLAASNYTTSVEAAGFQKWQIEAFDLRVGEIRTLSPVLSVGATSASITVSAAEATVNLTSATTEAVISQVDLQQTPMPGQNIFALAALSPGITGNAVQSGDNYTNEYAININAAGQRQEANGYMIDNAFVDTPSRAGGTSLSPNPEIVQSLNVKTNDFDAEKGRHSGATVIVYTTSGSNDFHGSVNYYFRNDALQARTQFQSKLQPFARNEIGVTFGGPIIKNKLFAFGSVDVLRSSSNSSGTITAETQEFYNWAKNWAHTYYPGSLGASILGQAPPQKYPTSNFRSLSYMLTNDNSPFPLPASIANDTNLQAMNVMGTTTYNYSVPKNGYQWSFRVDSYLTSKDRIYVSAIRDSMNSENRNTRPYLSITSSSYSDFVNINWTHTFSPRLLNQMGANLIRPEGQSNPSPSQVIPYLTVNGVQNFSNWGAGNYTQNTYGWHDVITSTVKSHEIKFGIELDNVREADHQNSAANRPSYTFANLLDLIQDKPYYESAPPVNLTTMKIAGYDRRYRNLYQGYFVQDNWKVTPSLTLTAGLRYDSLGHVLKVITPALSRLTLGSGATANEQIANATIGKSSNQSDEILDHNAWLLSPRVGFSWNVFKNSKTAVRGGFGIYSDVPPYVNLVDSIASNLPNRFTPVINYYSDGSKPTFALCDAPNGFNQNCPIIVPTVNFDPRGGIVGYKASIGGYPTTYGLGQVDNWTLSVQQQVRDNLVVEINYSGSAAHHLPVFSDINRYAGDMIANKGSQKRLNPSFSTMNYWSTDGNSIGHFGSILISRPPTRGFSIQGVYTFGKALDVFSHSGSLSSGSATTTTSIIQRENPHAQRGRADFDIRQQFSATGSWMLPNIAKTGWKKQAFGNWQLGGTWMLQSGLPLTVYTAQSFKATYDSAGNVIGNTGGDYNADGNNYDVPNVPSFGRHLSGMKKANYLKGIFAASSFPAPALGVEGNLGRNTYDNPGFNSANVSATKFITVPWFFRESMKVEAKAEVYDLFNRANLGNVTGNMNSSLFGTSTSQRTVRYMQFHLRTSF